MKLSIVNQKGQKVVVVVELVKNQKGLAFIMHGLGGFKEQPHLIAVADVFKKAGYSVVRFDATNSDGESDGKYELATTTNYYHDLEDIIGWSKKQKWYIEPFCIVGHSLGGICAAFYAENHPKEIKALAPISTVVSGKLSSETSMYLGKLDEWKRTGWFIKKSSSKPGVIRKLPWSHMKDRLRYDLLKKVNTLTMPVLMVVGDKDEHTPVKHQKILFEKLPGKKEMHIIKGANHDFNGKKHLNELRKLFAGWLKRI